MKFLIFSDLDGTFLNHDSYSFGTLNEYVRNFKFDYELIFVSSKTYEEILEIQRMISINFPFIAENGACIFFPKGYLKKYQKNEEILKYKQHFLISLTNLNSSKISKRFSFLKKKYMFQFYVELSENKLSKITNLCSNSAKLSKIRNFTNPIFWEDSLEKKKKFKDEIKTIDSSYTVLDGGRFVHISDKYDKGIALKKFLGIKNYLEQNYRTISLGDSENDLPMLELTDFSCIIKSKSKINLKKKKNIVYRSKMSAPDGWKESLDFIFKKEI